MEKTNLSETIFELGHVVFLSICHRVLIDQISCNRKWHLVKCAIEFGAQDKYINF